MVEGGESLNDESKVIVRQRETLRMGIYRVVAQKRAHRSFFRQTAGETKYLTFAIKKEFEMSFKSNKS